MTESFVNDLVRLIRPLFPRDARIVIDTPNNVILRIDWKLRNDPSRPNKRSRLIKVVIPQEVIDRCDDVKKAGLRFKEIIEDRLSSFHPDHNSPRCGSPPRDEWIISTFDVN